MRSYINQLITPLLLVMGLSACQLDTEDKQVNPPQATSPFVINQCDIQFNGQPLQLGDHIDEWVKVLGPYDRNVNRIYVWDEFGIQVWVTWFDEDEAKAQETISLDFIFSRDPSLTPYEVELERAETEKERKEMSQYPTPYFQGSFLLDGVVMSERVDFDQIAQQRTDYHMKHYDWKPGQEIKTFHESYVPSRWAYNINCPDGQNYGFIASLVSNDYNKMRVFTIGN